MTRAPRLTLSQLRAFEAVARTGGVLDAARELQISQPSVSTQVRALEVHARTPLFLRDGRQFRLTPLGDALFQKARAAIALADDMDRLLDDRRGLDSGELRIGYSAHQFAMPMISDFVAAWPGVRIEARCMASLDLLARLRANLSDVVMVTAATAPEGFATLELRRDPVVLMVPGGHPLLTLDQPVGWRTLDGLSVVRREESSGTRRIFEERARIAGCRLRTMVAVGSWSSMAQAVGAGIGVGVALAGELAGWPQIHAVAIDDPHLDAGHYLVADDQMRQVAAVAAFFDIARRHAAGSEAK